MGDPLDRMGLWFDAEGKPITARQWATLLGSKSYKILAQTPVTEDVLVSTVWLGLDYGFMRYLPGHEDDPPLIFETMVFVRSDTPRMVFGRMIERDGTECYRWSTREVALAGHMRIVAELRGCVTVETEPEAFTCQRCGRTSHHPKDIAEGYCGHCHDWTKRMEPAE